MIASNRRLVTGAITAPDSGRRTFVLQEVQPALLGLMDGSVSTLAPHLRRSGSDGSALERLFCGPCCVTRRGS